jgi:proline iminopeptidase
LPKNFIAEHLETQDSNPISTWVVLVTTVCWFEVSTAQELANNGFYVIVYDRRGEGRSTHANAKFTFQETFDDINGILKIYNLEKVNLIGHSFELLSPLCEKNPTKVNRIG